MQCLPQRLTLIAKPTHECNLGCVYCYVGPTAERGRMSTETLEKMTVQACEVVGPEGVVDFLWHGGEPLAVGLDFYKTAVEIQKRVKGTTRVENSMQTNGTLLTEETAQYFQEHGFSLGFSIDGPAHLHDTMRPYRSGGASLEDCLRGIKIAKVHKIGSGAIVVINKVTLPHIQEIYVFLKTERIGAKFNPLIKPGSVSSQYPHLGITPKEYGEAMIRLFDVWFDEPEEGMMIDPFEQIMGNITSNRPSGCNFSTSCQNNFLSIGPQGHVYPCGRFDGDNEWLLGSIHEATLVDILGGEKRKKLLQRSAETVPGCSSCDYKEICNAGCMHNAYMLGNLFGKDYYCGAYRMLFEHITQRIHTELKKAEVGVHES